MTFDHRRKNHSTNTSINDVLIHYYSYPNISSVIHTGIGDVSVHSKNIRVSKEFYRGVKVKVFIHLIPKEHTKSQT